LSRVCGAFQVRHRAVQLFILTLPQLFFCWAAVAQTSDLERVVVLRSNDSQAILEEALVRISAELRAVGFDVELARLATNETVVLADAGAAGPAGAEGSRSTESGGSSVRGETPSVEEVRGPRLELEAKGDAVEIRAYSGGEAAPLVQLIELSLVENAEVIAIRAVELLRAALLQSLRDGRTRAPPNSSVARFTNFDGERSPLPEPKAQAVAQEPAGPPVPMKPQPADSTIRWLVGLAPAVHGEGGHSGVGLAAEVTGALLIEAFYIGATVESGLMPLTWTLDEGEVRVRPLSFLLRSGWDLPCQGGFECQVGAAIGYHGLYMTPEATSTASTSTRHASLLIGGEALFGLFSVSGIGGFLHGRVGGLLDAPNGITEGVDQPLGRPSWNLGLGLAFRSE
jgi:hypothetical protein